MMPTPDEGSDRAGRRKEEEDNDDNVQDLGDDDSSDEGTDRSGVDEEQDDNDDHDNVQDLWR